MLGLRVFFAPGWFLFICCPLYLGAVIAQAVLGWLILRGDNPHKGWDYALVGLGLLLLAGFTLLPVDAADGPERASVVGRFLGDEFMTQDTGLTVGMGFALGLFLVYTAMLFIVILRHRAKKEEKNEPSN
jgi:hypothetical protein